LEYPKICATKRVWKAVVLYLEYLYSLMDLSKPIKLEEESLVSYFIDGVPNSKSNKAGLYRAKTVKDLKVEIEIYEKVTGNAIHKEEKKVYQHNIQKQAKKVQKGSSRKCYKCGKEGHFAKQWAHF